MDPTDFLALSGKLVGMGKAGARSATSRAYYSVFHLAQGIVKELTGEACGRSHILVPQYIESSGHPDAKAAAILLSDLHHDRVKADYSLDDDRVENRQFAQDCVESAATIQSLLQSFQKACETDPTLLSALMGGISRIKAVHGTR